MRKNEHEQNTLAAPEGSMPSMGAVDEAPPVFGDRYEVLSLLGSGGMGTVYKARDRELDEVVALKVLRAEAVATPGALEMFKREVKLARRVTHPNVARTFDIGEAEGRKYLTMEYIEGASLSRMVEEFGRMPIARVIDIARQIALGLEAAHAVGVVHRDLKPENVLVRNDERLVITDFGIARPVEAGSATVTMGVVVGTPAYMAPEQVEARRDLDHRADIYALGVLLFEVLSGTLPFTGDSALAVAAARLVKPPPDVRTVRPDVPDALANLVLRCMARDRDARYANMQQVLTALTTMTTPLPIPRAEAAEIRPANAPTAKTVAVLPFRHSGSSDDEFTADGLWDDLIDGLSMTRGLRVRPRSSLARYATGAHDPIEVGKALGVDVIVEGSLRRQGEHVRVTARLLNVSEGFQLWAKRFERESRDLFALSDEIASTIAHAVTLDRDLPARGAAIDPAAMDLYLKARFELRKVFGGGVDNAAAMLEEALVLSPDDPTLLATYAAVQVRRWFFGRTEAGDIARTAAERALALAPHLVEARHALAMLELHSGDVRGAVVELRNIATHVSYGPAHELLAGLVHEMGLVDEARQQIDRTLQIDPESLLAHVELAKYYALRGQWDEVDLTFERLARTSATPRETWASKMRFAYWRGDLKASDAQAKPGGAGPLSPELMAIAASPDPVDPQVAAEAFSRVAGRGSTRRKALLHQIETEIASARNETGWALAALERAVDGGLFDVEWLHRCPMLASIRSAPAYGPLASVVEARAAELATAYRTG